MSKHLLNGVQIRAIFQQMCCKAVAEGMWCNVFIDFCLFLIILDNLPESLARHSLAADIDKKRLFLVGCYHVGTDFVDLDTECVNGAGIQWNNALLPFAHTADKAAGQTHIRQIQRDELCYPNTGCIQQL